MASASSQTVATLTTTCADLHTSLVVHLASAVAGSRLALEPDSACQLLAVVLTQPVSLVLGRRRSVEHLSSTPEQHLLMSLALPGVLVETSLTQLLSRVVLLLEQLLILHFMQLLLGPALR